MIESPDYWNWRTDGLSPALHRPHRSNLVVPRESVDAVVDEINEIRSSDLDFEAFTWAVVRKTGSLHADYGES